MHNNTEGGILGTQTSWENENNTGIKIPPRNKCVFYLGLQSM